MKNPKLLEAIAELESQRSIIEDAIAHLRKAHEALTGDDMPAELSKTSKKPAPAKASVRTKSDRASYVNEAVAAITLAGHKLHVTDIVEHIKVVRGEAPARTSVEASLAREKVRAKEANRLPRIVKAGPSTFDIYRDPQTKLSIAI